MSKAPLASCERERERECVFERCMCVGARVYVRGRERENTGIDVDSATVRDALRAQHSVVSSIIVDTTTLTTHYATQQQRHLAATTHTSNTSTKNTHSQRPALEENHTALRLCTDDQKLH